MLPLLFLLVLPALVSSAALHGKVALPGASEGEGELRDTWVALNGVKVAPVRLDGTFSIWEVPADAEVLSVLSQRWVFDDYVLSTSAEGPALFKYTHGSAPAAPHPSTKLDEPYVLTGTGPIVFGTPKKKFDLKKIVLGNPMILVLLLGGAMAWGMPKLMESLDPEILADVQKNQKMLHESLAAPDVSKFLAGTSGGSGPTGGTSTGVAAGKGPKKRR